jgi:hypothetical protein
MSDELTPPCPSCGGGDFYLADIWAATGLGFVIRLSMFKSVPIKAQVCMTCGAVAPKLDRHGLQALRAARAKAEYQ